jgi:two-component system OmpR family sensor kinase
VTLRLRLLLLVVAIAAAGLLITDGVTYNSLRSFLSTRLDQQLQVAALPVGSALLASAESGTQAAAQLPVASSSSNNTKSTTASGAAPATSGRTKDPLTKSVYRNGAAPAYGGSSSTRGVLIPPGTYGQLRNAKGTVLGHLFFSYGGKVPSAPQIPHLLPGAGISPKTDLYFSTTGMGSQAIAYRAVAKPLANGNGVVIVAVPLTDVDSILGRLLTIEMIVSGLVLLGLAIVSWGMVRRDLQPLEEIAETAGAIARGDLSQRAPNGDRATEVGQLGLAFNTMVDEIEVAFAERLASEERLRRFLADASHELRTPLTSILGYAELFGLGVRDKPADLATAMTQIKSEAGRMNMLVNDLLLLAKLDYERPLSLGLVDLCEQIHRSVRAIRVSNPDRLVSVDARGPAVIIGDEDRLRRVFDSLLVNAVKHTPESAGIDVFIRDHTDRVIMSVHDNGPGIDPAVAPFIFQPFFRADPSRARSSGGVGLGLAIAASIVEGHGGSISAKPGDGATFVVTLPKDGPPTKEPERVAELSVLAGHR